MKLLQKSIGLAVAGIIAALVYQYVSSHSLDSRVGNTERRLDEAGARLEGVVRDSRSQGETLKRQEAEVAAQGETLGVHSQEIADLKKRVAAAESRLAEVARAAEEERKTSRLDRGEIDRLRGEVQALGVKVAEEERARKELEDLRKDLRRSLELERRLQALEKQLGLERPQP